MQQKDNNGKSVNIGFQNHTKPAYKSPFPYISIHGIMGGILEEVFGAAEECDGQGHRDHPVHERAHGQGVLGQSEEGRGHRSDLDQRQRP